MKSRDRTESYAQPCCGAGRRLHLDSALAAARSKQSARLQRKLKVANSRQVALVTWSTRNAAMRESVCGPSRHKILRPASVAFGCRADMAGPAAGSTGRVWPEGDIGHSCGHRWPDRCHVLLWAANRTYLGLWVGATRRREFITFLSGATTLLLTAGAGETSAARRLGILFATSEKGAKKTILRR